MNKKLLAMSLGLMLAGMILWIGGCADDDHGHGEAKACCGSEPSKCCGAEVAAKAKETAGCCGDDPAKCCGAAAAEKVGETAKKCPPDCTKSCCVKE